MKLGRFITQVGVRVGKRQGERTDLGTCGNISTSDAGQKTRDLAAAKAGLGSGKTRERAPPRDFFCC